MKYVRPRPKKKKKKFTVTCLEENGSVGRDFYTPSKTEFQGGILFSACRQHLRVLHYNFDGFCPILFKFTPHLDHQTMHVK